VNGVSRAVFAGVLFLVAGLSANAGPSDERGAMLRALAGRVGVVLGAASSCPNIHRARINAIADKIAGVIKSSDESAAIFELLNKSQSEGARSVAAKQTDCAAAERQLADLESASSPEHQASAAAAAPVTAQPAGFTGQDIAIAVRGVSANEIRFGASVPLSGPSKDYGQQIRFGIEAAFRAANDAGGVHGRMLRFIAADDGYEPARTPETLKQLYEKDQVFGFIGNFGTPTAEVSLPFALERRMLSFAGYSGANLLRRDPPDHYVFNYRPSYSEETDAAVRYLVKLRRLKPEQIAVFAQQDAYGDAGFNGVAKAMRALRGGDAGFILRLGYARNTVEVDGAVAQLKASKTPIKAIVMQATYRPAAQFIAKTHDAYPGLIYTNPSTVGSNSLREELSLLGPKYMAGVIITQVVPAIDGYSALVLRYKDALSKYFGGEVPDFISLEYYVAAQALIEGLKRTGPQIDTEKLIESLESIHDLDLGLGTPVNFNGSEHQASHKIWGTQMNESGKLETIELQ
jgi:branched-chain amino acid transport system substrate-binding protein